VNSLEKAKNIVKEMQSICNKEECIDCILHHDGECLKQMLGANISIHESFQNCEKCEIEKAESCYETCKHIDDEFCCEDFARAAFDRGVDAKYVAFLNDVLKILGEKE